MWAQQRQGQIATGIPCCFAWLVPMSFLLLITGSSPEQWHCDEMGDRVWNGTPGFCPWVICLSSPSAIFVTLTQGGLGHSWAGHTRSWGTAMAHGSGHQRGKGPEITEVCLEERGLCSETYWMGISQGTSTRTSQVKLFLDRMSCLLYLWLDLCAKIHQHFPSLS